MTRPGPGPVASLRPRPATGATPATERLDRFAREHPEWRLWLALLGEVLREASGATWAPAVPVGSPAADGKTPLLAGTVIRLDRTAATRWLAGLAGAASSLADARVAALDPLAVLEAAVGGDRARLEGLARESGAPPAALAAVADLAALPLLWACGRKLGGSVSSTWWQGYCPVCGAWPTFAEARGVERSRRFRCGRCGADWGTDWLRCPFCETRDHARLGALVPERGGERRRIETCAVCRGYLKTLTVLTGTPADQLLLEDLASVDLDLAALQHGYRRPDGLGQPMAVAVVERPGRTRRLLAWRR